LHLNAKRRLSAHCAEFSPGRALYVAAENGGHTRFSPAADCARLAADPPGGGETVVAARRVPPPERHAESPRLGLAERGRCCRQAATLFRRG
jgi:hypothetical protein